MATFERYFVIDKATHVENKNAYYDFQDDEQTALRILNGFGLNDSGFIINGHVPVKLGQGESPIKAGGRLLVIDGGLVPRLSARDGHRGIYAHLYVA